VAARKTQKKKKKKEAPARKKAPAKRKAAKKKVPAKRKAAETTAPEKKAASRRPAAASRTKAPARGPARARATPRAGLDVDALLERLDRWSASQERFEVRLTRLPPLDDQEIEEIPSLLTSFPFPLPTPYEPARFVLPQGYRALLRRAGGMQIEYRGSASESFQPWPVLTLYRPGDCSLAHQGKGKTLADSWTVIGTSVGDRAFTTTDFIAFADGGFAVEASRWCLYTGGEPGAPLPIYIEDNDFECLLGRYLDTGEWISDLHDPVFPSFEAWLSALVEVVCSRPFDPEQNDATVNAIIERGSRHA